ncbi:MAG: AraC family transcriptional regulator [Myxococcota bacterium]
MDPLSRALRSIHVDGLEVARLETRGAWGTQVPSPSRPQSVLVIVSAGELWVEASDATAPAVRWVAGDVGLLLPGHTFTARTAPGVAIRSLEELRVQTFADVVRWGQRGRPTCFTALHCPLDQEALVPFADALPPMSRVGDDLTVSPAAMQALVLGTKGGRPGAYAALERMSELVLIESITAHLQQRGVWLGPGADDPLIVRALRLLHVQPEAAWTVASLARRVGMSRTAFATRFRTQVGEPPIRYLTRYRLERAEHLLLTTGEPVATIARRVGYDEVPAFCRAFKRMRGRTPGAVRERAAGSWLRTHGAVHPLVASMSRVHASRP